MANLELHLVLEPQVWKNMELVGWALYLKIKPLTFVPDGTPSLYEPNYVGCPEVSVTLWNEDFHAQDASTPNSRALQVAEQAARFYSAPLIIAPPYQL